MSYQDELFAKLDAARTTLDSCVAVTVNTSSQEQKILAELDGEFEFGQYDLAESDIFRTLKILDILDTFPQIFAQKNALKLFYILCRVDAITAKNLLEYCKLPVVEFKAIINAMARHKLLFKNSSEELELTLEGKSLAARIGVDIFF